MSLQVAVSERRVHRMKYRRIASTDLRTVGGQLQS